MKKLLCALLTLVMVLSLGARGGGQAEARHTRGAQVSGENRGPTQKPPPSQEPQKP